MSMLDHSSHLYWAVPKHGYPTMPIFILGFYTQPHWVKCSLLTINGRDDTDTVWRNIPCSADRMQYEGGVPKFKLEHSYRE